MAKPRRRQEYTPALLENLRVRFEETDESVVDIAASIARRHTTLRALAREHGWTKYRPPPLDLSPAARLAAEAGMLAAEAARLAKEGASSSLSPRSGAEGRLGLREHGEAGAAAEIGKTEATDMPMLPTPDPSPPLASLAGGGEKTQTRWRKFDWDDELTEDVRHRYEETNESIKSIAAAVEMSDTQLRRKIEAHGWRRPKPVKRGLSPVAKLAKQADALLAARGAEEPPPLTRAELRPAAETLLRAAQAQAAELETLQRQASAAGQKLRDTQSLTGNIAMLAATIGKLTQLCAAEPQRPSDHDDNDLDQQRDELARRIDALVDEWLHAAAADGAPGHPGKAGA